METAKFQVVLEDQDPWPESESRRIEVHYSGEIAISPTLARRRAQGFLGMEVAMATRAGEPSLVVGLRPIWRIPAYLAFPGIKESEPTQIGSIDVDAMTGEVIPPTPTQIAAMRQHLDALFISMTPLSPMPPR